MPDQSPNDWDLDGWRRTDPLRARPTAFFGFIVIEQLYDNENGERQWRRIKWPTVASLRPPQKAEG